MVKPIRLSTENFLLFSVMIFAAGMRLWNVDSWTFTNDELSALNRLHFDSINNLLSDGVSIDAHPLGTQLFLYLWTKLFGISEAAIRIPFVALSLVSTYGIYKIGKTWVHAHLGIIAATIFAGLGFTVTYSILARPYAMGTFAFVLVLWTWTILIKKQLNTPFLGYFGFCISLALCAYTHYFAGLTAGFVFLIGFLFLRKNQRKPYIFSGLGACILFLPHVSIFIKQYQQSNGGTAWLGIPENTAILDFLFYGLNESWLLISSLIVMLLIRTFIFKKQKASKLSLFGVTIFALASCFSLAYSNYVAPIFQYSILSFAFIGLILSIADLIYFPGIKIHTIQTGFLILILIISTFITNDFRIESRFGTFEKIALCIKSWEKNSDDIIHVSSINHRNYLNYYFNKHGITPEVINLKLKFDDSGKRDMQELAQLIDKHQGAYFSYSKSTLPCRNEVKQLIKTKFPHEFGGFAGENCESTLFGRGTDNKNYLYRSQLKTTKGGDSTYMYHHTFPWKALNIKEKPENCQLAIVGESNLDKLNEVVIVVEVRRDGTPITVNGEKFWTGSDMSYFVATPKSWNSCVSVIDLPKELNADDEIHLYIYNPENTLIQLRNYEIKLFKK